MNAFDKRFFLKYLPEWSEVLGTVHSHVVTVLDKVFLWFSLWAFIPTFIYVLSYRIQDYIPFIFLEALLFWVFIKIMYDIFDWYLDVWIITEDGIYDLHRKLLKIDMTSIKFESIEGVEIEQFWIWDKIWRKWDLILHQLWHSEFRKINADNPFKAAEMLEWFLHHEEEHEEEKKDRFELILETLWGIVEEYLDRKGIREKIDNEEEDYLEWIEESNHSIDLRTPKEKEKHIKKFQKKEEKKWWHGESHSSKHGWEHHDTSHWHWWHH
jgi:hypothetical protein